jgi:large subunit ribosomal protein L13
MIVDAENKILGRLASRIAEEAKNGADVEVVNSEKAVISGDREEIVEEYRTRVERGTRHDGPYYPKRPDRLLKRTVRGMLPYKSSEGKEALRNVRTYLGKPEGLEGEEEEIEVKEGTELRNRNYVKLGEVSRAVGWSPRGEEE